MTNFAQRLNEIATSHNALSLRYDEYRPGEDVIAGKTPMFLLVDDEVFSLSSWRDLFIRTCDVLSDKCMDRLLSYVGRVSNHHCFSRGEPITETDVVALNIKLFGKQIEKFLCLSCLAESLGVTEEELLAKIEEFKAQGCKLFG